MTEIPRLDAEQLRHLEGLLAHQGAVVVQRLRSPASAEAIAAVEDYLGRPLPSEVKTWWAWHDGTDDGIPGEHAAKGLIGPFFEFHSTTQAIYYTQECRDDAEVIAPDDPDATWGKTWLAIGNVGKVACESSVEADAPVPILDVDYHHVDIPGTVFARSFGEMVSWWIEALEVGAWRYEPERDVWNYREDLVPPERVRLA